MPLKLRFPAVGRWSERWLWVALAGFLLYRFVWPSASAPVGPKLAAAVLATHDRPLLVEFSSRR